MMLPTPDKVEEDWFDTHEHGHCPVGDIVQAYIDGRLVVLVEPDYEAALDAFALAQAQVADGVYHPKVGEQIRQSMIRSVVDAALKEGA